MARDRDYELGLIINPDVGEDQARAIVERVSQSIIGNGGQVVRVNAWGRRRLTYPIQHHRDGLYYFFDLIMPPVAVVEIERGLRVNEDVIRHLMKARDPKVVAQQRQRAIEEDRAAEEARARAEAQAALAPQEPEAPVAEEQTPATPEPAETTSDVPTETNEAAEAPAAAEPEATSVAPETDA
ncbi:MAG TPA: 30S ribosomal protein S6 [Ktedonobacterales bacterium]|nr:30S ribosomal protein S6 [Ktedonobacterales bacterium]